VPNAPFTLMDSDGDIRQLIPLWIECGITAFTPMEVAAAWTWCATARNMGERSA